MKKKNEYRVGMIVSVDVESLYKKKGDNLKFCYIEVDTDDKGEPYYFDLYTKPYSSALVAMDGEACKIAKFTDDAVVLTSYYNSKPIDFMLTKEEFYIAC